MTDFWLNHGIFFLLLCQCFPRLTIVFGTAFPIGFDQVLFWLFFPRFFAAYLATIYYFESNPYLVAISWLFAINTLLGQHLAGLRWWLSTQLNKG